MGEPLPTPAVNFQYFLEQYNAEALNSFIGQVYNVII